MYSAVFIFIFFECIYSTRSALTYTIVESALNPNNIKLKIDGTIELPTRNIARKPSFPTENESQGNSKSMAKIGRMGSESVEETGRASTENNLFEGASGSKAKHGKNEKGLARENHSKAKKNTKHDHMFSNSGEEIGRELDKDTSREMVSIEYLNGSSPAHAKEAGKVVDKNKWIDSSDEENKPGQALVKDSSRENNSPEDLNDSTAKLRRPVYAEGSDKNVDKKKRIDSSNEVTTVKETGQTLNKDSSDENNSPEDLNDSTAKLRRPVYAKEADKAVNKNKWIASSNEVTTVKETNQALDKVSSKENSSPEDSNDSTAKLRRPDYSKDADKAVDKKKRIDSTDEVTVAKETAQALDKYSTKANSSPEDSNDSTAKLRRPVYAKVADKTVDKKKRIDSSDEVTAAKETEQALDKDSSKENSSPEHLNDSTAKLRRPVDAKKADKKKRIDSSDKITTVKETRQALDKDSSQENKSHKDPNDSSMFDHVVPLSVKGLDMTLAIENQFKSAYKSAEKKSSSGKSSFEDLNESKAKLRRPIKTYHSKNKNIKREPKLHRHHGQGSPGQKPGGVTHVSRNQRHHLVKDDKKIQKFAQDIYRQTLEAFDEMKQTADSFTQQQLDALTKSYKMKYRDFLARTGDIEIKTKEGARNVVMHIMETSNLMMDRIVNFLKENMILTDELGPGGLRGGKLRLDQEAEAAKQIKDEHACKEFGACHRSDGLRTVLLNIISILIKLPDARLVHVNDAATEALKYMDLSKVSKNENTLRILQSSIRSQEKTTGAALKFSLSILYGSLSKSHLPLVVNKAVYFERPAVKRTVSFHSLVDALEEALPPTPPNKTAWAVAIDRLKRWADGQPLEIQDILKEFFANIINGIGLSKKMKTLIAEYVNLID